MKAAHHRRLPGLARVALFFAGLATVWLLSSFLFPDTILRKDTQTTVEQAEPVEATESKQGPVEVSWLGPSKSSTPNQEQVVATAQESWRERIETTPVEDTSSPAIQPGKKPLPDVVPPAQHDPIHQDPREGDLPTIVAEYRPALSFPEYLDLVEAVGGQLVLYNETTGGLVGWFDRREDVVRPLTPTIMSGMSIRSREVPGEPWLRELDMRLNHLNPDSTRWILLFPKEWDRRVENLLRQSLTDASLDPAQVNRISARYHGSHRPGVGKLTLEEAYLKDGRVTSVNGSLSIP